jgi:hypothetical protein
MGFLRLALNDGTCHSMDEGAAAGSPPAETADVSQAGTEAGVATSPEPGTGVNETGGQRQSEYVPISRFQEVNAPYSALNQRAREAGYGSAQEYVEALEAVSQQQPEYYSDDAGAPDPLLQRVEQMENFAAELAFDKGFTALQQQYPNADRDDVKRLLLMGEARGLPQAMERIHQRETAKRERVIADYQASLRQRQDAGAEGGGGGAASASVDFKKMPREEFKRLQQEMGVA